MGRTTQCDFSNALGHMLESPGRFYLGISDRGGGAVLHQIGFGIPVNLFVERQSLPAIPPAHRKVKDVGPQGHTYITNRNRRTSRAASLPGIPRLDSFGGPCRGYQRVCAQATHRERGH